MKNLSKSHVILVMLPFGFSLCAWAAPNDVDVLRAEVKRAQEVQIQMSEFLDRFSVEVVREETLKQGGRIDGSIKGSGISLQLGNVSALAQGLGGLVTGASSVLSPLAYFDRAALGFDPISSLLQGLSGWGYGSMSVSGSLHGEFTGRGVEIHNQPHLFLVVAKNSKPLRDAIELVERARAGAGKTTYVFADAPGAEVLASILSSPYIPDVETISVFRKERDDFKQSIRKIDLLVSSNIGSKDSAFSDAEKRVEIMKAWANSKRVTFAVALPDAGLFKSAIHKPMAMCFDPGKYTDKKDEVTVVGKYISIGGLTPGECVEMKRLTPTDWQEELRDNYRIKKGSGVGSFLLSDDLTIQFFFPKEFRLYIDFILGSTALDSITAWKTLFDPTRMQVTEERLFY